MAAVLTGRRGGIFTVTLNRPESRNAWNRELVAGLRSAWSEFAESDDRVCVLRGSGPLFSAGLDLKDTPDDGFYALPNLEVPCNKPILVAAEGAVIGFASTLCLLADMVFAGSSTYFLYPEAKMGLFQGMTGGFPGRLQYKAGLQWLMTADPLTAQRACEIGLINEVVPDGKAFERTMEVANKIAANAPLVVQAMKALALDTVPKGPMERNFRINRLIAQIGESEDGREGLASFREKRAATFSGR